MSSQPLQSSSQSQRGRTFSQLVQIPSIGLFLDVQDDVDNDKERYFCVEQRKKKKEKKKRKIPLVIVNTTCLTIVDRDIVDPRK